MIEKIHLLLTYQCTYECPHCFLYCAPRSEGTFTLEQIKLVLDEVVEMGCIKWIYFEGGEPFLYYPVLFAGLKAVKEMGLKAGVVTNGYFATSVTDALLWLKPFATIGIDDLNISDDWFHDTGHKELSLARNAYAAAKKMQLPVSLLCTAAPPGIKGAFVNRTGDPLMFRGRAADKLVQYADLFPAASFTDCPYENLSLPKRVHLDAFGNVHICQGLVIGNMWETGLSEILAGYNVNFHPICDPLAKGGPLQLATSYVLPFNDSYADACHFCYSLRLALLERFPQYLQPRQVYNK